MYLESPGAHPLASLMLESCNIDLCAVYADLESGGGKLPRTWSEVAPFFQIAVLDDEFVIASDQFAELKETMKSDTAGLRASITQSIAATPFDMHALSLTGEELEFVGAPTEFGDTAYEGDSYLAFPATGSNDYKKADSSFVTYEFDVTFGFIHASDKIVVVILFGPEKDSSWGKRTFEYIADELAKANMP